MFKKIQPSGFIHYIKQASSPLTTKVETMASYLKLVSLPQMAQPLDLRSLRQIQAQRYMKFRIYKY
ncbi:hypothetical protein BH10PSE19_BH10PSE19_14890 [soil metagenome]